MNIRQTAVPIAAVVFLCLALCLPSWVAAASADEAGLKLTEQYPDNLRQEGLRNESLEKLEAFKDQDFNTEDEFLVAERQETGNDQTVAHEEQNLQHAADDMAEIKRTIQALQEQNRALAKRVAELEAERGEPVQKQAPTERQPSKVEVESKDQKELEQRVKELETEKDALEQRVKELEIEKDAQELATRAIIRDSLATVGSKINEAVALGGTFEMQGGVFQVFEGSSTLDLNLITAQLDFEIQVNDWTLGLVTFEYLDGTGVIFPTVEGFESGVDRINLDQSFFTIGDTQRFPPFLTLGRMVVPFGISTGAPVADVLTFEDPLTIEAFETREDALLIGFAFPTPPLTPAPPPVTPPPVRPLVLNPLVTAISKAFGYKPRPPAPLTPMVPTPQPPPFNAGFYFYNGDTLDDFHRSWRPSENFGATVGFRTQGTCGRSYDELRGSVFCPWSIDIDVDYNNSVFDSLFLESEAGYKAFLNQIGFVPGIAASVKASLGPMSVVGEWNGAINPATFVDDKGIRIQIEPFAWQVTLGYQLDWNPWVESIGAQGNYLAVGYSESRDLAGAWRTLNNVPRRVGNVPKRRLMVTFGEWVLSSLRVVLEYSYNWDYSLEETAPEGTGTGKTAHGLFGALSAEW